MTPDQLAELKDNAALRKRLAKRMARDCFRNSSRLEEMHVIPQIAAITGHSLKTVTTILETYLSRTRALAEQAIVAFENAPRTKFVNQLQTGTPTKAKGECK